MRTTALIFTAAILLSASQEKTFYLSPDGSDLQSGSYLRPWASPEHAIQASQEYLKAHPGKKVTIIVQSGEYPLIDSLTIDGSDFRGSLTIKAAEDARPVITSEMALTAWEKPKDARAIALISPKALPHILVSDLKSQGISDYGSPISDDNRLNFYYQGKRQQLGRYPNKGDGFLYAGKSVGKIERERTYLNVHCTVDGILEYQDDRVSHWAEEQDPCLLGYWQFNWSEQFQTVQVDTIHRTLTLGGKPHGYGYRDGCRYYGINLLSEVDTEGEYYLDREQGLIYWYAPQGFDAANPGTTVSGSGGAYMLTLKDCEGLTIEGLDLTGGRGGALHVIGGRDIVIKDCGIRRMAKDAVTVEHSKDFRMWGCELEELDCAGLRASGGDRKTLETAGFEIEDCTFRNLALFRPTYQPAIHFRGCGMRIRHCLFDGNASSALRLDGNDVTVEYSEFCNLVQESEDQGGVDMHNDFSFRGIVIRYNYWHDIGRSNMAEAAAIRFDDIISGAQVYGNVFENCGSSHFGAVQIHGGMDNIIRGNVFLNCTSAVSCSPWDDGAWKPRYGAQKEKLEAVDFYGPVYRSHYSELVFDEQALPAIHNRNYVQGNLLVNVPEATRRTDYSVVEDNQSIQEQGRTLPELLSEDFLRTYGLDPIPFQEIGSQRR